MDLYVKPSVVSDASLTVPGDKSISHRALMLGSIAEGTTEISGLLTGEDCLATWQALTEMGVKIEHSDATTVTVSGVGMNGLKRPSAALDLGNSGTAMRLMAGLLAGQTFDTTLTGDESLTSRPMQRIVTPLAQMGAIIECVDGRPPLTIRGGRKLHAIDYNMPVASAQVKSAVLIAGLYAHGVTRVQEPAVTRDHTERMLRAMGTEIETNGFRNAVTGPAKLTGCRIDVPADLSSAAFVILAALLSDDADILITNVGVNPTRTGVIRILQSMGANIEFERRYERGAEPVADLRVRSSVLTGGAVDPELVSLSIDEFPVLFVAAAAATGTTTFTGIGELRVKESDRIASMSRGLRTLGIDVEESDGGAVVHGGEFGGGVVDSFGDHRIAMALAVAGSVAKNTVTVRDAQTIDTSFPGFVECMRSIGMQIANGRGS